MDTPGEGPVMVTFPDGEVHEDLSIANINNIKNELANGTSSLTTNNNGTLSSTVKFEEKRSKSASKTKVMTDGVTTEQETSNSAQMKRLQAGDIDYKEAKQTSAVRNRLEMDGITAEQNAAQIQVSFLSLRLNYKNHHFIYWKLIEEIPEDLYLANEQNDCGIFQARLLSQVALSISIKSDEYRLWLNF